MLHLSYYLTEIISAVHRQYNCTYKKNAIYSFILRINTNEGSFENTINSSIGDSNEGILENDLYIYKYFQNWKFLKTFLRDYIYYKKWERNS